jgi:hypothetical protein
MLRQAQFQARFDDETYSYGGPALTYELEHCLLFGKGSAGQLVIRHRELFTREWRAWRELIMPKWLAAFPGRRPAAMYITGELPMRPIQIDMPLSHPLRDHRGLYVIGDDGDGFWYRDWPEPYQRGECRWLREIDAIDDAEAKAARGHTRAEGLKRYCWHFVNMKKKGRRA